MPPPFHNQLNGPRGNDALTPTQWRQPMPGLCPGDGDTQIERIKALLANWCLRRVAYFANAAPGKNLRRKLLGTHGKDVKRSAVKARLILGAYGGIFCGL